MSTAPVPAPASVPAEVTAPERRGAVSAYVEQAARRSERSRIAETEKTGVATGAFALHPVTRARIPMFHYQHAGLADIPDTIAKLLFTSGSTGAPKGVINTHRMMTSNQAMLRGVKYVARYNLGFT